jgi:hypothetical protein
MLQLCKFLSLFSVPYDLFMACVTVTFVEERAAAYRGVDHNVTTLPFSPTLYVS